MSTIQINFDGRVESVIRLPDMGDSSLILCNNYRCFWNGMKSTIRRAEQIRLSEDSCIYYIDEPGNIKEYQLGSIIERMPTFDMETITFTQAQSMKVEPDTIIVPDGQPASFKYDLKQRNGNWRPRPPVVPPTMLEYSDDA